VNRPSNYDAIADLPSVVTQATSKRAARPGRVSCERDIIRLLKNVPTTARQRATTSS
jgi:hypothetical protein